MRILVIEDNSRLAGLISEALTREGFQHATVDSVGAVPDALRQFQPDLIVLDLGLPDGDGIDLLTALRGRGCDLPVLILTARDALDDRVRGLDAGGDDYLVKPFALAEFLARLRALMRRPGRSLPGSLVQGNLTLDTTTRQAWVASVPLRLGQRETQLLELFMRRVDRIVPREAIEAELGPGRAGSGSRAVEVLVHRLRRRLAQASADVDLHTLRGAGYLLQARR